MCRVISRGAVASEAVTNSRSRRTIMRRLIDLGAGVAVAHSSIGRQHLHALRFEDDERGLVNRGDLVFGETFSGSKGLRRWR